MIHICLRGFDLLEQYSAVILCGDNFSGSEVDLVESYVRRGGGVIAICPDGKLAALCGVERKSEIIHGGYIQVEEGNEATAGVTSQSIQFHGSAFGYKVFDAKPVAWLDDHSVVGRSNLAIGTREIEQGLISFWAFDLARSIAYTRQGNPQSPQENDLLWGGRRTVNQFVNWIDLDRIEIPQADEHQKLFVNVLSTAAENARPLPTTLVFPLQCR